MEDYTRLCHAVLEGDVSYLQRILENEPNVLRRCMIQNSGSFTQSPLHIAAEMGHVEIVKALLEANPNMCLIKDEHGRNPIHIAAMMGNVEVFKELVRVNPQAARKRANGGETYLHLCIEYGQTQALTELLRLTVDLALLNATDSRGDTILHYAVHSKNFEIVRIVAEDKRILKYVRNDEGLTALGTQIFLTGKKLNPNFRLFKANMLIRWNEEDTIGLYLEEAYNKSPYNLTYAEKRVKQDEWIERNRSSMPLVASLIAAMSFQVGIRPPGGTWQDSDFNHNLNVSHVPGASIINSTISNAHIPHFTSMMMNINSVALFSSLTVILFSLVSNLVLKDSRCCYSILMTSYLLLGTAVTFTMLTYIYTTSFFFRPSTEYHFFLIPGVVIALIMIAIISAILFLETAGIILYYFIRRRKLRSQITRSSPTLNAIPSILP